MYERDMGKEVKSWGLRKNYWKEQREIIHRAFKIYGQVRNPTACHHCGAKKE